MIALLPILRRFWPAILILALVIALMITRGTLATRTAQRDAAEATIATVQAEHRVTLGSVATLRKAADDANAVVAAQADFATKQRETSAANAKLARERNASLLALSERLKRDAAKQGACTTSDDIMKAGL